MSTYCSHCGNLRAKPEIDSCTHGRCPFKQRYDCAADAAPQPYIPLSDSFGPITLPHEVTPDPEPSYSGGGGSSGGSGASSDYSSDSSSSSSSDSGSSSSSDSGGSSGGGSD